MENTSRTANSIKNITMGFMGQGIQMVLGFVSRMIFVRCLSQEYLGISSLFSNILSMLSLAELGIGTAIVYALYKPLAEKDEEKIASLMRVYSVAYRSIGIIVGVIGACLIPFLDYFIAEAPSIRENIKLIYCIYLFNTSVSYFFSYKCSILNADQKNYIVISVNYAVVFFQTIIQIVLLLTTKNFILYLLLQALGTFIYNVIISSMANKRYPCIRKKKVKKLDEGTKKDLFVNIKALVITRISGVLVNSTDSIIISALSGLAVTGVNANYTLLTQTLNAIITQVFNGISASVGNLNAVETTERKKEMFEVINLMNFWLYGWSAIGFIVLANDIVKICFGDSYILPMYLSVIIAVNYYTYGMQNAVWTYKSTMGLFRYGRYMVLLTGIINLVLSIGLGKVWGLFGILFATFIARVITNIWYDPYVVFTKGFHISSIVYMKKYLGYLLLVASTLAITYGSCQVVQFNFWLNFFIKIILCALVPNIIFFIFLRNRREYQLFIEKIAVVWNSVKRIFKKVK